MPTRIVTPTEFRWTRIIGFSVIHNWWTAMRTALGSEASKWELQWFSGGSIDLWADPNMEGWVGPVIDPANRGGLIDPINPANTTNDPTQNLLNVDRVILVISGLCLQASNPISGAARPNLGLTAHDQTGYPPGGYCGDVNDWSAYIGGAIATVRAKMPNARMIYLQPNLGGPGGSMTACVTQTSNSGNPNYDNGGGSPWSAGYGVVRCTYTSPFVKSAISHYCRGNVRLGYQANFATSNDSADWAGHLVPTASDAGGAAMANWYLNNV